MIRVASLEEVPPGTGKVVTMMGREVGIFNVNGEIRAIDNICPHSARPIGSLGFDGKDVTCLWHGLKFDLETGICPAAPHYQLRRYPVRIRDAEIFLGSAP